MIRLPMLPPRKPDHMSASLTWHRRLYHAAVLARQDPAKARRLLDHLEREARQTTRRHTKPRP